MQSFVSKWDFFARNININFAGREQLRTTCGGIISLLLLTVFLIEMQTLMMELIDLEEPTIQQYEIHEAVTEYVNLHQNRMVVAFKLTVND